MTKKVIAFDLDGTLAPSKSPLPDKMAGLLRELLQKYEVCVISGGKFGQFKTQLLGNLGASPDRLQRLHLMPTCGTRYYLYDLASGKWEIQYAEDFNEEQKKKIIAAVKNSAKKCGFEREKVWGEQIEDRGSQISWSALGQDIVTELGEEGIRLKEEWDPSNEKKAKLRNEIALEIPEFEVRAGGVTTIDITKMGIDKAYGMKKLMSSLQIGKDEILFIGDRMREGGNDYPVKLMGIDSVEVRIWEETAACIDAIRYI